MGKQVRFTSIPTGNGAKISAPLPEWFRVADSKPGEQPGLAFDAGAVSIIWIFSPFACLYLRNLNRFAENLNSVRGRATSGVEKRASIKALCGNEAVSSSWRKLGISAK